MYFPSGFVPLDPGDYILSEKLLIGVSVDTFMAKMAFGGMNLLPSPLTFLFSTPWPSRLVQAII
jgi:hypothetical protein